MDTIQRYGLVFSAIPNQSGWFINSPIDEDSESVIDSVAAIHEEYDLGADLLFYGYWDDCAGIFLIKDGTVPNVARKFKLGSHKDFSDRGNRTERVCEVLPDLLEAAPVTPIFMSSGGIRLRFLPPVTPKRVLNFLTVLQDHDFLRSEIDDDWFDSDWETLKPDSIIEAGFIHIWWD